MAKIDVKDLTGAVKGSIELSDEIFGIEPNAVAMSTVVRNQLATEDRAHRRQRQEAKYPAAVRDLTDRRVQVELVMVQQDPHSMLAAESFLDPTPDHTATQYLRRSRDLLLSLLSLQRLLPRR